MIYGLILTIWWILSSLKSFAKKYPKVNLVWQPDGVVNGIASINAFYRDCCDKDTIYMKLDDDVVWFEPELFEKMVKFRVDNPEYFFSITARNQ